MKFGNYYYARLYLDGTSDSDGKLTNANSVNVRFVNGAGFKLTMDMFSFSNVNGGDIPGTDFLISEAVGQTKCPCQGKTINWNMNPVWDLSMLRPTASVGELLLQPAAVDHFLQQVLRHVEILA